MIITFSDKKFQKIVHDNKKLNQKMGSLRADKIRLRLNQLNDAVTLEDVRNLAGKYHELKSNRKGQWACDLDQPYRLIFKPHEDPIPTDDKGWYIWSEIRGVEIIEITNYHEE